MCCASTLLQQHPAGQVWPDSCIDSGLDSVLEREAGEGFEDICKLWWKLRFVLSWLSGRGSEDQRDLRERKIVVKNLEVLGHSGSHHHESG